MQKDAKAVSKSDKTLLEKKTKDSAKLISHEEASTLKNPEPVKKPQDGSNKLEVTQKSGVVDQLQRDVHIEINDLDKVCRICLVAVEEISSLHQSKDYSTFVFLLQACHKSGIPIDNTYPSNICKVCSSQLQNITHFIKKLKDATEQLNLLFEKDYELIENENCSNQTSKIICVSDDEVEINEMEDVEETIIIEEDFDECIQETSKGSTDNSQSFKGFKCDHCNRTFNYFTSWQCHMITHEEINKNKCQYCSWIGIDEQKYQEHLETTHRDLIHQSKKSKKTIFYHDDSDTETKSKNLARLTIDGLLKCNKCETTFKNSAELNRHILTHNEPTSEQCEYCGKKYVDQFSLQLHLDTAHENQDLSQFDEKIKKDKIKRERKIKEKPGEYSCDSCNKQFAFKSSLNRHIQIVHEQTKRFCCDICGEKFTVKNSLKYHMYIHTDSKPYPCNLCSKAFRQPAALFRHQRTKHSIEKNFLCDICMKTFKTSKGLGNHSLKHAKGLI